MENKGKIIRLRDIPKLKFGVVHSQMGFDDGVSIVMNQIEDALFKRKSVPRENFYYLVGKANIADKRITVNNLLWQNYALNKKVLRRFNKGLSEDLKHQLEYAVYSVSEVIESFVEENKIDVLIVHNSSHPVNFIMALGVSKYYELAYKDKKKVPKHIIWWHDSHLERERFKEPAPDIKRLLLEGVPGRYVDYIVFINSNQFKRAENYFMELNELREGYYERMLNNYGVIYNTTKTFIESFEDLEKEDDERNSKIVKFLECFGISDFMEEKSLDVNDVLFVLQHTRIVGRKRIDFALKYCYALQKKLKEEGVKKALVLFVSGRSGDELLNYKRHLLKVDEDLKRKYPDNEVFFIFAENFKTSFKFGDFPLIFSWLKGMATYFSEVEGFGNNLLEVLAAGLIPVVYTYEVFVTDIYKKKFSLISVNDFKVTDDTLEKNVDLIKNNVKRKFCIERNIKILKENFSDNIISSKLGRAIIRS